MGHINYDHAMFDRKGITENVTLDGNVVEDWTMY